VIQSIVLPGRFPTTFHAYPEFTLLSREVRDEVRFTNLNLDFWAYLFSPPFLRFLRRHLGPASRPQLALLATVLDAAPLATLQSRERFYHPEQYLAAIAGVGSYLAVASQLLRQLSGGCLQELSIYGVAYDARRPLRELVAYAGSDRSPVMDFYRTRAAALRAVFAADVVSAVTYNYTEILHLDVLAGRFRRPGCRVLIHGHSWENIAVDYLLEHSRRYAAMLQHIDGLVLAEGGLAATFNRLTEAGATARIPALHRFHGGRSAAADAPREHGQPGLDALDFARLGKEAARQRPGIYAPELVTLHRLSGRGCPWSRCAFCRHNSRHPGRPGTPEDRSRWPARLRELRAVSPYVVFCDQGIDPEDAGTLAAMAAEAGGGLRWSLRTRLDPRWDAGRLAAVARGGCVELIVGLESVHPATLRRMHKTPLRGAAYRALAERLHRESAACGLSNHYCVIYGYPGEPFDACRQTLDALGTLVRAVPKTTFSLNRFQLLYKSDLHAAPAAYGIRAVTTPPALSPTFGYDEPRSARSIARVERDLPAFYRAIGYRADILADPLLTRLAPAFVSDSGHTPLLKVSTAGH
jgi:hypothetical protein